MSVSHFVEIQQKEKESLAAYIHHFKREASRCKFDNDVATIRLFIKGLKNPHTLATRVYEKGPQSLVDAIREVEKLQAVQELTATLLPSSSVNTMSNDDDKCFQSKESGHIACQCPHIKCFNCGEHGHVAADCPDKVPTSGTPARCRNNSPNARQCNRSTSHNNHCDRCCHWDHWDRHRFSRLRSHSCSPCYRSNIAASHTGVILGPITDPNTTTHHAKETQTHTATDEAFHIGDPHYTEVTQEIAVDPDHAHYTNTPTKHHQNHHTAPTTQPGRKRTGNINKSPLLTHHPNITALMTKPANQIRI